MPTSKTRQTLRILNALTGRTPATLFPTRASAAWLAATDKYLRDPPDTFWAMQAQFEAALKKPGLVFWSPQKVVQWAFFEGPGILMGNDGSSICARCKQKIANSAVDVLAGRERPRDCWCMRRYALSNKEASMGWADCGTDSNGRPIGYAVAATCDHPECASAIDRGLSYACGGMHGAEDQYGNDGTSCERYFCEKHRELVEVPRSDSTGFVFVCHACAKRAAECTTCKQRTFTAANDGVPRACSECRS